MTWLLAELTKFYPQSRSWRTVREPHLAVYVRPSPQCIGTVNLRAHFIGMTENTKDRVPAHTDRGTNAAIREKTAERLIAMDGHWAAIDRRLRHLDKEWDIERAIEANASVLAFVGVALGYFISPLWLLLPALVTAFLFQHAIQGWCPPVPLLRSMGFRTSYEIDDERHALKALRGDYAGIKSGSGEAALFAAEK